jgi:hypothetical protein
MFAECDKVPNPENKCMAERALKTYKRITRLRCLTRCGMCGSTRYATKPFWSLGMRVCKFCVQANTVSNTVLFRKYWITLGGPVLGHCSFIEAIMGSVFYFQNRSTPHQRLEFSSHPLDYPGGTTTLWFFWMPHLMETLDMERLRREAEDKQAAASKIKSSVRQTLLRRTLFGEKKWVDGKDRRMAWLKIRKTQLLDRSGWYTDQRVIEHLSGPHGTRLHAWEDRVLSDLSTRRISPS